MASSELITRSAALDGMALVGHTAASADRARPAPARRAPALVRALGAAPGTLGIALVLVLAWAAERMEIGRTIAGRPIGYLAFGALPNATVVGRGSPADPWRYVSAALVHDIRSPLYVSLNVSALLVVGITIERRLGSRAMLATAVLGAIAGDLTWLAASALGFEAVPQYVLGASTAVCALVGLLVVHAYLHPAPADATGHLRLRAWGVLGLELVLLVSTTLPYQDFVAHVGAAVAGAVFGLLLRSLHSRPARMATDALITVGVLSTVAAVANVVHRLTGG